MMNAEGYLLSGIREIEHRELYEVLNSGTAVLYTNPVLMREMRKRGLEEHGISLHRDPFHNPDFEPMTPSSKLRRLGPNLWEFGQTTVISSKSSESTLVDKFHKDDGGNIALHELIRDITDGKEYNLVLRRLFKKY